jgi:hypothetical protein
MVRVSAVSITNLYLNCLRVIDTKPLCPYKRLLSWRYVLVDCNI